jgi:hypothetical protein
MLWQDYNMALQKRQQEELQLYVERQKDMATAQATAPLQQQIADLKKLVSDQQTQLTQLHEQMQTDATAALQAKAAAHSQGLEYGAGIGVGAALVLLGLIFGIKKMMSNFTVTKKPQAQGAVAGK